jgi:hypothetical protein
MTAHEQYYTQSDVGAIHITYADIRRIGWESIDDNHVPTLSDLTIEAISNDSDGWECKFCLEPVGWHWFQAGDTDAGGWHADFWSLNEDSSEVACDTCFDRITAEQPSFPEA